jgi:hypothetical protein
MMCQAGSDVAWQAAGSEAGRRCNIYGNLSIVKEKFLSLASELSTSVPKAGCVKKIAYMEVKEESPIQATAIAPVSMLAPPLIDNGR